MSVRSQASQLSHEAGLGMRIESPRSSLVGLLSALAPAVVAAVVILPAQIPGARDSVPEPLRHISDAVSHSVVSTLFGEELKPIIEEEAGHKG